MTEDEPEAVRMHRDVASARRSFIIIFTVGILGTVGSILLVLKNRPEGDLSNGSGRPAPALAPRNAPKPCKKFGDRCELAAGQLGACVQKEQCTGARCLFCQAQH